MAVKTKRRSGIFGKILYTFILLIFFAFLASAALIWLGRVYDYAEQYELSRPARTIDAYVEAVNRDRWNDGIARAVAAMPHEAQSDDEIREFVQEKLSSGISAVRKAGTDTSSIGYSLRCDGREIGSVTLVEDPYFQSKVDFDKLPWPLVRRFLPGILEWGMTPWIVSEDSYDFTNLYNSVEITVPATYSVYLNGTLLGSEYIVEDNIHYSFYEKYYNDLPMLPTKVRYRFDNVIGEVESVIVDDQGNTVTLDESLGDYQFIRPVDPETRARLEEMMEQFTEKYLRFRSGVLGANSIAALNDLKPYLTPSSDIEVRGRDALDGLSWAKTTSFRMTDFKFNGALPLVNGLYVCSVTATTDTYVTGKGEVNDVIELQVIVYDDGETPLAYRVD